MAEASRSDANGNVRHPTATPQSKQPGSPAELKLPELPESASPASNPALNRSAEAVGRRVGTAVAGVRNLRSRIHLVGREWTGSPVDEIKDSALEAAVDWRNAAEDIFADLRDTASLYGYEVTERANRSLEELRRRTASRLEGLRRTTRQWLALAQAWEDKQPLRVIGACAVAAFALGVALRIRRSNCD